MGKKDYEERLRMLKMTTLERRRLRGDLIQVFKIFRSMERVESRCFFVKAEGNTGGHELKLVKPRCRLDCRKYSFFEPGH
jgi:ribonucleases P/MRP protein subunit RPP40